MKKIALLALIIVSGLILFCKNNNNQISEGVDIKTTRFSDTISNYTKYEVKKSIENVISFYEDSLQTINNLVDV